MQFFGKISMAAYLVHFPLMQWIDFCIYGIVEWKNGEEKEKFNLPIWGVFLHFGLTIGVASLLTYFVEIPLKKFFKKRISQKYEE